MESHVAINFEEDFQGFCRKFEQRLKQTNERDSLTAVQIHSVVAAGEIGLLNYSRSMERTKSRAIMMPLLLMSSSNCICRPTVTER